MRALRRKPKATCVFREFITVRDLHGSRSRYIRARTPGWTRDHVTKYSRLPASARESLAESASPQLVHGTTGGKAYAGTALGLS